MTAFELLAYVLSFSVVLGISVFITVLITMMVNRNRAIKDFESNRKKSKHEIDLEN